MTLRLFPIRATMPPSHVAHTALVIVKEAVHARLLFSCASRCSDTKLAPCLISMGYRIRRMRNGTEEDDTKAENAAPSAEGIPFGGKAESCAPSDNDAAHPGAGRASVQARRVRVYRPKVSGRVPAKRASPSMGRSLALQCMVCALIFLMVLGIQKLELPASDELVNGLRFVVSNDAEFVEEGRQQVGQWMEQAVAVFAGGGGLTVRQPAEGTAEKTERGLVYTAQGPVCAVADGTVF